MSNSTAFPDLWAVSLTGGELRRHVARVVSTHYHSHFHAVRRYAFTIVRCSHDAEDIAQESFVRLILALERGSEPVSPLPWLLRVAHNLAVTRASRRRPEGSLEDSAAENLADVSPNPEETAAAMQRQRLLRKALTRLTPQELRCWTLRAEGLRYREIAEVLDVRTGTVATLLVRAADKLSAALPNRYDHSKPERAEAIQ